METLTNFIFMVSKITMDGDSGYEIKRRLLFGRKAITILSTVQFNSVTQSCPTLSDPMNRSTPGLPVHHQLPEFTQTHVNQVSDAIEPSHPLSSPSPPAPILPSIRVFSNESSLQSQSVSKSRGIILQTMVHIVKSTVFPLVMYRCESWTIKKAEHRKINAFKLQCWRRLFRVPWTARRSNQSITKEINHDYSLEGLMLRLKLLAT